MGQKFTKFEWKFCRKIPTMGQFLKKHSTDYFQNCIFFHVGEVPNQFQQKVEMG